MKRFNREVSIPFDRITVNPAQMNGQPCIRGMRLTVKRVLKILATYSDRAEIRHEYPELDDEDIRQALEYAAASPRPLNTQETQEHLMPTPRLTTGIGD